MRLIQSFTKLMLCGLVAAALGSAFRSVPGVAQEAAPKRHVVLIGGLGGEERYTEDFKAYLFDTRSAFVERFGAGESNVVVLAETAIAEEPFVDDVSNAENITATFEELARTLTAGDELFIILFGHGSFDGTDARLNIPRRDLTATDYAVLIDGIPASRIVFVNTASASGPFVSSLSGPDRIVITATRAGSQRNATEFPRYFVEALEGEASDLDKDGALTLGEVFRHAAAETDRYFSSDGLLATEFALLDDDGDGTGHELDELQEAGDGALADVTFLARAMSDWAETVMTRPELTPYMLRRDEIEREVATLKARKGEFEENAYYRELERLFVQLARLNEQIEGMTAG